MAISTVISANTSAQTAEPAVAGTSAYRLNVANFSEYRLMTETADSAAASTPSVPTTATPARTGVSGSSKLAERPFAQLIEAAAREMALDPALVHAVIAVESGYNATARSPKGALGLMQVMPETGLRYGVRQTGLLSPADNLRAGTRYLGDLMEMFDKRLDLVLAAYNAGEKAVQRHGMRIPPYPETRNYVPAVLARYHTWREPPPSPPPLAAGPTRIQYMPGTVLDTAFRSDSSRR